MPAHTSHLLQPLNVGYFSPLKTAYGHKVGELARQGVFYINKNEFLNIYPRIRTLVFLEQNIKSRFRVIGLIPSCLERVLASLTVIRMPLPAAAAADSVAWTAETPHTIAQLE